MRRAVLDATLALLFEDGEREPSLAEIAARADVHETSIRRRWGTREQLILDALLSHSDKHLPIPDTGTLLGDLTAFGTELVANLSQPLGIAIDRALVAAASDSGEVERMRVDFWRTRFSAARDMVTRAIARGELPETVNADLLLEMYIAPLHFRTLLTRTPLDAALPARLARVVVAGSAALSDSDAE